MTSRARHQTVDERELSAAVTRQLGKGAEGRAAVVWAAQGSEVVVHLDSVDTRISPGQLQVRVDLETDETGRVSQSVRLALAHAAEPPNFTAIVDLSPSGEPRLAARWGPVLQDAVWSTVLGLAGADARGVAAADGALIVYADPEPSTSPASH